MNITVYLGSTPGNDPLYTKAVRELGSWIGSHGHTLIYGGSDCGLMGELADSALKSGGYVIGVEPSFFVETARQHEGIQELIVVNDMSERKAKMLSKGDAFIAFPGGVGTLEEISEIMARHNLGVMEFHKPCIIYNLNGYYDALKQLLSHMVEEGFLPAENCARIQFAESLDEIARMLPGENVR